MKKIVLSTFVLFCIILSANAELKMPAIFGDNMLLQQNMDAKLWGYADKGKSVTIRPSWTSNSVTAKVDDNGKWSIRISTPTASYDTYSIEVSDGKDVLIFNNVLIGEVWLCSGQSNMEMGMKGFRGQPIEESNEAILKSKNKNIRIITVKRASSLSLQNDFIGQWQEVTPETVRDFSAIGYYYGKLLNETLDVPVGLILSAWGGSWVEAWMSKDMLSDFKDVKLPTSEEDMKVPNRTPMVLYNSMINPIAGYTIKGCIWYQGESNYKKSEQYSSLFEKMVSEWRKTWEQGEFPFYYCQIAPYDYESIANENDKGKYNSAFLREAQYKSAQVIPNSGMAVLMDLGEEKIIHPRKKKTAAERLAVIALAKTYRMKGFAYESPTYKAMEIEGNKAILEFDKDKMWLTSYSNELKAFEIAGDDKVFYPAKAEIKRSKVEVWSDKVAKPVAVRYAFKDFVMGDLFGTEGFPVSSFRTDNWNE